MKNSAGHRPMRLRRLLSRTTRKLLILRRTKGLVSGTMDRPAGAVQKPAAFRQAAEPKEFNLKPEGPEGLRSCAQQAASDDFLTFSRTGLRIFRRFAVLEQNS